ncbi:MAG: class I SAM-dependent methyltransferase [Betaproteobacteria bacterium]
MEPNGTFLPLTGIPVYYFVCRTCGFCFAPKFSTWSQEDFKRNIYNDEYAIVDPGYIESRPRDNAENMKAMFPEFSPNLRHLDYGGGEGLLSSILKRYAWNSESYDPIIDNSSDALPKLGKFDLITAFEVFEHVSDLDRLMTDLNLSLIDDGIILFSTLLSDGNIDGDRITWWYASPRNGHISLFSKQSLTILANKYKFMFGSFSPGFHILARTIPAWAKHIL